MIPVSAVTDRSGITASAEDLRAGIDAAGIKDRLNAGIRTRQVVVRADDEIDHTRIEIVTAQVTLAAYAKTVCGLRQIPVGGEVSYCQTSIEVHVKVVTDRDLRANAGGEQKHACRDGEPEL
jgi:hypothetical protein